MISILQMTVSEIISFQHAVKGEEKRNRNEKPNLADDRWKQLR